MTSIGRQAAIGLCATLLAGAAGCVATPQYPIEAGQAPGDGGVHLSQRPQYPIDGPHAAAPRGSYPDQYRAPPPPTSPAPSSDADDTPRSAPSAPVDSSALPPPDTAGEPHLIFGLAEAPPVFELAAYRRHRHASAAEESTSTDTATNAAASDSAATPKTGKTARRHGRKTKASGDDAQSAQTTAKTTTSDDAPKVARQSRRHHRGRADSQAAETAAAEPASTKPEAADASTGETPYQVTVKHGERLADVAKRLHTTKQALMDLNGLTRSSRVRPGAVLKAPYRFAYQVQKGDTLYAIGHRFHQDTDELAKLNAFKHAAQLQPGQTVELPASVADLGARDHAHGDALTPEAAPAELIAKQTRKERRAAEREARREAKLDARRDRRTHADAVQVAQDDRSPPRRHAFTTPPTDLTSANLSSAAGAATPTYAAPSRSPLERSLNSPVSTAFASNAAVLPRPSPLIVPPPNRPGYSVANEMASQAAPRPAMASTTASTEQRQIIASGETGLTSPSRPYTSYSNPPGRPAYPSSSYAAARAPGLGYAAGSTYAGTAAASAPSRVASLGAPSYGGSLYGGPALGRARPVLPSSAGTLTNSAIAAAGLGRFVWPMRGAILEPFGDHGGGQRNDGLDIVAQPGEGVHAAASGEVVYAGSSIPGFGNLILVKHPGGWVTAYAHLDRIEVRMRDTVVQGQEIGQAGQTGAGARPPRHFEVRYAPQTDAKARPVDPTLVLPGAG